MNNTNFSVPNMWLESLLILPKGFCVKKRKRREKRKVLGEVMAEDGVAEGEGEAG